ncbi:hypothetical protein BJ878DRAFT_581997 [Calycina marina]|uniref:Co-chaperone HscB C-terminal oligomerisation domain-containing protein n=1 Tax=Calycina marina TaxID=1763456 RepID=A0A9P7Z535_9HELO|nr:hypothetical protein BJ878DRAFT_581997 [Calycina marina]
MHTITLLRIRLSSTTPPRTHYELFPKALPNGPPPSGPFPINLRALRAEFLQLQAKSHPDLHPISLKTRAEATSALINEAYNTLQSPLARAQYLLSLKGMDVSEDESAKIEDPAFLTEVMDVQERIEEIEEGELEEMVRENEERISKCEGKLERCFGDDDLEGARREAVRLRYWVNVRGTLHEW